jgi:phage recombination protein Bet
MNAEPAKLSLMVKMAAKHNMEPHTFQETIRKTVMPSAATVEEVAAFLMVAQQYRLDPILREIHAFPKKGGGIMPVISVDGWASLVNQHPAMNGMKFVEHKNNAGRIVAMTCVLYRKDRDHPIEVTEYMEECFRNTEPWKTKPNTMLRHKALIQCARYAFGFSGVYDNDEAERINEIRDVSPAKAAPIPTDKTVMDAFAAAPIETPVDLQYEPETGEITEPSAADAYELGRQARDANRALKALPGEMREPGQEKFADAWQDGWRSRDEEIHSAVK